MSIIVVFDTGFSVSYPTGVSGVAVPGSSMLQIVDSSGIVLGIISGTFCLHTCKTELELQQYKHPAEAPIQNDPPMQGGGRSYL